MKCFIKMEKTYIQNANHLDCGRHFTDVTLLPHGASNKNKILTPATFKKITRN